MTYPFISIFFIWNECVIRNIFLGGGAAVGVGGTAGITRASLEIWLRSKIQEEKSCVQISNVMQCFRFCYS